MIKDQAPSAVNAVPIALHRRILRLGAVRHFFGTLGHIFAYIGLSMILFTTYFGQFTDRDIEAVFDNFRQRVEQSLAFVFPEYFISVGAVTLDNNPVQGGWIKISAIELVDPVGNRTIDISEFRYTPSFIRLVLGEFRFSTLIVESSKVEYQLDPPKQGERLVFPINILDIPAAQLAPNGRLQVEDFEVVLRNSDGEELLGLKNLQAGVQKTALGYDFRLAARQISTEDGAFVLNISRQNGGIVWDGSARRYQVSTDRDLRVETDLGLAFANVPAYDFTEQSENALNPYQYLDSGKGLFRVLGQDLRAEARYEYDAAEKLLRIPQMSAEFGEQEFAGALDISLDEAIYLRGHEFAVRYPGQNKPVLIDNGQFFARADLKRLAIDIGEFSVKSDDLHIYGNGTVGLKPALYTAASLNLPNLSRAQVLELWPHALGEAQYDLIAKRIDSAQIRDLRIDLRWQESLDFDMRADIVDAAVTAVPSLPKLQIGQTFLSASRNYFQATAPAADFVDEAGEPLVALNDARFALPDLRNDPRAYVAEGAISATLPNLWRALAAEPIAVPRRTRIFADQLAGAFQGQARFASRLERGVKFGQTETMIAGTVDEFALNGLIPLGDLRAERVNIKLDQNGVAIDGLARINAQALNMRFAQAFRAGARPEIALDGVLTRAGLASLGFELPRMITGNSAPVRLDVDIARDATSLVGRAEIDDLGIALGPLGTLKSRGENGAIDFRVRTARGGPLTLEAVNLRAPRLSGDIQGTVDGGSTRLDARNLVVGGVYRGNAVFNGAEDIVLSNGVADLTKLGLGQVGGSPGDARFDIKAENLRVRAIDGIELTETNGQLSLVGSRIAGGLTARMNGATPLRVDFEPQPSGFLATLRANDGGRLLRDAGYYNYLRRGDLVLRLRTTATPGVYGAKINLKKTYLYNDQAAVKVLQAASIFGPLDPNGIFFNDVSADLVIRPGAVEIYSGYATGEALGVSVGGSAVFRGGPLDLFGVVTPAYLLNGNIAKLPLIGELIGAGDGEGVFGVTYRIGGTTARPRVEVNPLSILTPGRFRQLWGNVPQAQSIPPQYRVD